MFLESALLLTTAAKCLFGERISFEGRLRHSVDATLGSRSFFHFTTSSSLLLPPHFLFKKTISLLPSRLFFHHSSSPASLLLPLPHSVSYLLATVQIDVPLPQLFSFSFVTNPQTRLFAMPPETPDEPTRSGPSAPAETSYIIESKDVEKIDSSRANMDLAFRGIDLPWDIWSVILEFVREHTHTNQQTRLISRTGLS